MSEKKKESMNEEKSIFFAAWVIAQTWEYGDSQQEKVLSRSQTVRQVVKKKTWLGQIIN